MLKRYMNIQEEKIIDVTDKFLLSPILKIAIEEASKSTHPYKVSAIIFKGKRIVSIAHNSVRANRIPVRFKNFLESSHAEAHAIIKARKNLKNYDMLVIRQNLKGSLMTAKPCIFCQDFIDYVGIRNVYYSYKNRIFVERY